MNNFLSITDEMKAVFSRHDANSPNGQRMIVSELADLGCSQILIIYTLMNMLNISLADAHTIFDQTKVFTTKH
jgi:hypothetical protein